MNNTHNHMSSGHYEESDGNFDFDVEVLLEKLPPWHKTLCDTKYTI